MQSKTTKTIQTCFRLEPSTHKLLHARAAEAGLSSREWVQRAIVENETKIVVKQKPHPDLLTLIYHVNKTGNNLNQMAHHFNTLKKQNKITKEEFIEAVNTLDIIKNDFNEAIRYACKN